MAKVGKGRDEYVAFVLAARYHFAFDNCCTYLLTSSSSDVLQSLSAATARRVVSARRTVEML